MKTGEVITINAPFVSITQVNLDATDAGELYSNAADKMMESMASFMMTRSNWKFKSAEKVDINTVVYKPLRGSSYIPLPGDLAETKIIINMKNEHDNKCFKWCVTRAVNPVDYHNHPSRVRITKEFVKQSELNWSGINFLTTLNEIDKFERNNEDISVNVYGYETRIYPLRISKHERKNVVDLLLIANDNANHYCLIKKPVWFVKKTSW